MEGAGQDIQRAIKEGYVYIYIYICMRVCRYKYIQAFHMYTFSPIHVNKQAELAFTIRTRIVVTIN